MNESKHPSDTEIVSHSQGPRSNTGGDEPTKDTLIELESIESHSVAAKLYSVKRCSGFWSSFRYESWCKSFSGWRGGILGCIIVCTFVLLVNLMLVIIAVTTWEPRGGIATAFTGDCNVADRQLTVTHFFINVLGSLVLASSNYCMQRLAAPTRREIDTAHARRIPLNVGVPSVRNLFYIARIRTLLWILLGLSSLPFHFMYNSVVLGVTSTNMVTFTEVPSAESFWLHTLSHKAFANLTSGDCHEAYNNPLISKYGTGCGILASPDPELSGHRGEGIERQGYRTLSGFGSLGLNAKYSYCMSEIIAPQCQVQFSITILVLVILMSFVKLIIMWYILWRLNDPTIVTIGDALQSFLLDPDHTTKHRCLLSASNIGPYWQPVGMGMTLRWKQLHASYWYTACTQRRWLVATICTLAAVIPATGFVAVTQVERTSRAINGWNTFGRVSTDHLVAVAPSVGGNSIIPAILLVNTPQFIASFLYLCYNGVFTCMLADRGWTQYASKRAPLRVTSPSTGQRSTHFLQLPYSWSVPLLIGSALLHWLVSQSIFLARIAFYKDGQPMETPFYRTPEGRWETLTYELRMMQRLTGLKLKQLPMIGNVVTAIGYSDMAIIAVLSCILLLVFICRMVAGCLTFAKGLPSGGTNSAVLSAACHMSHTDEKTTSDAGIVQQPLQWGVTIRGGEDIVGHLSFSDGEVEEPEFGALYAGSDHRSMSHDRSGSMTRSNKSSAHTGAGMRA